jgi:TRAP transporter TAXI family solute receptor
MPPVQELAVVKNIRLLPIDEEADKLIKKELPYFTRMVVPKGTYTNVDEDVPHVLMWRLFIARPDVPDWAIEEFTRILYTDKESMDYLVTVHPAFKDNPNYEPLPDAVAGCGAPLHPGAEKVWRELGVIK